MVDELLDTKQVSELTTVPVATLRWWRHAGVGPKSFKLGARKVAYKKSDVVGWVNDQYNQGQAQ